MMLIPAIPRQPAARRGASRPWGLGGITYANRRRCVGPTSAERRSCRSCAASGSAPRRRKRNPNCRAWENGPPNSAGSVTRSGNRNRTGRSSMKKPLCIVAGAVFFASFGFASGQVPSRDFPDAANPTAAPPAALSPRSGTPDRLPAATMPEANAPDPATTGQAPTISEKMQPEMDSVGGPKSRAGEEKK